MKARAKKRLLITGSIISAIAVITVAGLWWHHHRSRPQVTINGTTWYVELATTDYTQEKGLSGRKSLADNAGMLFIYREEKVMNFWMRGCLIPIDIAFIDKDLRVLNIEHMVVEPDYGTKYEPPKYSSHGPAKYAFETAAGAFEKAGVKPGDKVIFSGDIPDGN